jgi:hypothetical protein
MRILLLALRHRPCVRGMMLAALVLALMPPTVLGHGEERHRPADELVKEGESLMIGSFSAEQAGPLVVVPFEEGPLPCGNERLVRYQIPIGEDVFVTFAHNDTSLEAGFALPPSEKRFLAVGVGTGDAVRALFIMQEHVVALHELAAGIVGGDNETFRQGALGVAHAAGPSAHGIDHPLEGYGITLAYDETGSADPCFTSEGHSGFRFSKATSRARLAPGSVVHVVVLYDPNFDVPLPRPIEDSTAVFQANLYLARSDEDPSMLRAALDPSPEAESWIPVLVLGAATLGTLPGVARRWRR